MKMIKTLGIAALLFVIYSCNAIADVVLSRIEQTPMAQQSLKPEASAEYGRFSSLPERIGYFNDNDLKPANFPEWVKEELGVIVKETRKLDLGKGSSNTYFEQYHKGFVVKGAMYILHQKNGKATYANGLLFDNISVATDIILSEEESNKIVQNAYPGISILKTKGPLILAQQNLDKNKFWFCFKSLIANTKDGQTYEIYVDINNKQVVKVNPTFNSLTEPGLGTTLEGRQVEFNTEYINGFDYKQGDITISNFNSGYTLYDSIRNLHTLSANNREFMISLEFQKLDVHKTKVKENNELLGYEVFETDNIWTDTPAAVEVHWGTTKTYDYFRNRHQRKGMDGNNGYLQSYVNFSSNYTNAFFHSFYNFLAFGDGENNLYPLTSLDIVAHEFTHGVVNNYVEMDSNCEADSINEAIADIFAIAITFYDGKGTWQMMQRVKGANPRDLKEPKAYHDPDTYEGEFWEDYSTNFELELEISERRAHNNGLILGYWFYMLSDGAEGENDNEDLYKIEKIGMKKATDIVYRSLQDLIPSISFEQYRDVTINATKDLYGKCSNEVVQVTNAWNAIGVGEPFCDCFEGSLVYHFIHEGEERSMKVYFKEDKTAVEVLTKDGRFVQYSSDLDRYWHVKDRPDFGKGGGRTGELMKNLILGKQFYLHDQPKRFKDRKEYVVYRNRHKTGNTKEIEGRQTQEYVLDGIRFWATEEVCLSYMDIMGSVIIYSQSMKANNRLKLFGLPVEIYYKGTKIWIDGIKEHPIDDSFFSG